MTIITDPQIAFGEPTIRGIRTRAIAERYVAGKGIGELAIDYRISWAAIEEALRFELSLPRRRAKQHANMTKPTKRD